MTNVTISLIRSAAPCMKRYRHRGSRPKLVASGQRQRLWMSCADGGEPFPFEPLLKLNFIQ